MPTDIPDADPHTLRVGFTATKKLGHAVIRNRAKRRMRALARAVLSTHGKAGHDYVLIARDAVVHEDFHIMKQALTRAMQKLHRDL